MPAVLIAEMTGFRTSDDGKHDPDTVGTEGAAGTEENEGIWMVGEAPGPVRSMVGGAARGMSAEAATPLGRCDGTDGCC